MLLKLYYKKSLIFISTAILCLLIAGCETYTQSNKNVLPTSLNQFVITDRSELYHLTSEGAKYEGDFHPLQRFQHGKSYRSIYDMQYDTTKKRIYFLANYDAEAKIGIYYLDMNTNSIHQVNKNFITRSISLSPNGKFLAGFIKKGRAILNTNTNKISIIKKPEHNDSLFPFFEDSGIWLSNHEILYVDDTNTLTALNINTSRKWNFRSIHPEIPNGNYIPISASPNGSKILFNDNSGTFKLGKFFILDLVQNKFYKISSSVMGYRSSVIWLSNEAGFIFLKRNFDLTGIELSTNSINYYSFNYRRVIQISKPNVGNFMVLIPKLEASKKQGAKVD